MATLFLSTVGGFGRKTSVTLSADGLFAIESLGQQSQRGVVHTSSQSQNQMQGRFLLDVVITQSSSIFQLLSGKDETLLIGRNSFLVLNLCLDIVNGIGWLDVQSNGLACDFCQLLVELK